MKHTCTNTTNPTFIDIDNAAAVSEELAMPTPTMRLVNDSISDCIYWLPGYKINATSLRLNPYYKSVIFRFCISYAFPVILRLKSTLAQNALDWRPGHSILLKTFKWGTRFSCKTRGCKTARGQIWRSEKTAFDFMPYQINIGNPEWEWSEQHFFSYLRLWPWHTLTDPNASHD